MDEDGQEKYRDNKDKIIVDYLYDGADVDNSNFSMENHDISLLSYAFNCRKSIYESNICHMVKKFIYEMIKMYKSTANSYTSNDSLNTYQLQEIKEVLKRDLLGGTAKTETVLSILFDEIDFSDFSRSMIEFYQEVFANISVFYFDSYCNPDNRSLCENIIHALEIKVCAIKNDSVRKQLYKSLTLTFPRYFGLMELIKCNAAYSYKDKQFLNKMISKYGGYHLEDVLVTIIQLHIEDLVPEIVVSLNVACEKCVELNDKEHFTNIAYKCKNAIMLIITRIFFDHNDDVNDSDELTKSFESFLEKLCNIGFSEAAVILDEFRIH